MLVLLVTVEIEARRLEALSARSHRPARRCQVLLRAGADVGVELPERGRGRVVGQVADVVIRVVIRIHDRIHVARVIEPQGMAEFVEGDEVDPDRRRDVAAGLGAGQPGRLGRGVLRAEDEGQDQPGHRIYPYLLRGVSIERPDQVRSADITYIPMASGFMYLAATIDWYSRYVVAWRLSNTLDGSFCLEMLDGALSQGRPEVFNTDQGVQFTAEAFTRRLESAGVAVSLDGRGRALDNVFVERLWRTVKYEDLYIRGYRDVPELRRGLGRYFGFFNHARLHQALGYRTPAAVYETPAP